MSMSYYIISHGITIHIMQLFTNYYHDCIMHAMFNTSTISAVDDTLSLTEISWNFTSSKAEKAPRSHGENILFSSLKLLLPNHKCLHNYKHPQLTHYSGLPMQFDAYYPDLR